MSTAPPAEIAIDAPLARALLTAQHPDLAALPLTRIGEGWDNVTFRLGDALALRLPRRAVAAPLILNEQKWLPHLAPLLPLAVPAPVRIGAPTLAYPWPWSVVPWIAGRTAAEAGVANNQGPALARFFMALHRPAPLDAPLNPVRGVPLALRALAHDAMFARVEARGGWLNASLRAIWREARAAPDDGGSVWLHGDPHPLNVLVDGAQRLAAFIDWGDCTQGDRASDLAAIWMLLDAPEARAEALALIAPSAATIARARGWAMYFALTFVETGAEDRDPALTRIGALTLARLTADREAFAP